jgi:hypothetical protein
MLSIFLLLFGVANASSSNNCVAIDSSSDSYVCTDSPIVSLTEKFDTGVPQRISGSPGETSLLFYAQVLNHLFGL